MWIAALGLVLLEPKADLHLMINGWHSSFGDAFFSAITWMGSGWMVLFLFLIFLFVRVRYAVIFGVGNLLITLLVQVGKHLLFPHALRPVAYFKGGHPLHLVEGVHMHLYNSFPSGHSATAFGIFVLLVFITRKEWLRFLYLMVAVLTAFSRVYLSQHFMADAVAGSIIGFAGMWLTVYYFDNRWAGCCHFSILDYLKKR